MTPDSAREELTRIEDRIAMWSNRKDELLTELDMVNATLEDLANLADETEAKLD